MRLRRHFVHVFVVQRRPMGQARCHCGVQVCFAHSSQRSPRSEHEQQLVAATHGCRGVQAQTATFMDSASRGGSRHFRQLCWALCDRDAAALSFGECCGMLAFSTAGVAFIVTAACMPGSALLVCQDKAQVHNLRLKKIISLVFEN